MSARRHLVLLLVLYFCQGLPGGFLAVVLPVILREQGMDLRTIGLASLLSLPWLAKIAWAPLVDRFYVKSWGRRRSWILPAQAGMIAVTLLFTQVRPQDGLQAVVVLFVVLNVLAATQDVAVDGLAVDLLRDEELGPGNATQVAGFKLGNLFGGGVLLALSGWLGWSGDFAVMAACLGVAWLLVLWHREPPAPAASEAGVGSVLPRLWEALRSQGLWFWLFLAWVKFGETFGGAMTRPMLVDRGFSRELIGLVDGLVGGVATIAGAVIGGLLARRHGWRPTLGLSAVGQGAALCALGVYALGPIGPVGWAVLAGIESAFGGAVGVAVFVLAMSWRDRSVGAAQFTAAQVVYMGGGALAAPLAGRMGDIVGVPPLLVAGGVMAASVWLLCRFRARALEPR
jgi:MFS transporter, PAT family, beta-lactamase induction signal transducer AmpG